MCAVLLAFAAAAAAGGFRRTVKFVRGDVKRFFFLSFFFFCRRSHCRRLPVEKTETKRTRAIIAGRHYYTLFRRGDRRVIEPPPENR